MNGDRRMQTKKKTLKPIPKAVQKSLNDDFPSSNRSSHSAEDHNPEKRRRAESDVDNDLGEVDSMGELGNKGLSDFEEILPEDLKISIYLLI
jgi:hypothetical protein